MKRIAIFASGNGSNAENLVKYFSRSDKGRVVLLLTDRKDAPAAGRVSRLGVEAIAVERNVWRESPREVVDLLRSRNVDFVALAGFFSVVGGEIVSAFPGRIVNLHPSLLPKFGGKGMWGMHVHRAVIAAGERRSGITVHYVSEVVDGGGIVAQFSCDVLPDDTPESLAARIHELEYRHFPSVVESLIADGK